MIRALYTAASGMQAQQFNLDTIANNLSNSSTAGFRRRRLQFQDLLYQNLVMPGTAATQQTTVAAGLQIGLGTRSAASEIIQLQGDRTTSPSIWPTCKWRKVRRPRPPSAASESITGAWPLSPPTTKPASLEISSPSWSCRI